MSIKDWLNFLKVNFKISTWHNLLLSIVYVIIIPLFRGTENLNAVYTAQCMEQSVSIIGIIMLVSLSAAEREESVRDVMSLKRIGFNHILILRFLLNMFASVLIVIIFLYYLRNRGCTFPYMPYLFGTISTMFFMGSLGFFIAELSENLVLGYLIVAGYYMLNLLNIINKNNFISLFTMELNTYNQKIILFIFSILLMFAGTNIQVLKKRF